MDTRNGMPGADLHVHSAYSYDACDGIGRLAEAAMAAGLSVLTVSDHCDMRSSPKGYRSYFPIAEQRSAEIEALKARCADRLTLLNGLELGDVANAPALAKAHLREYDYDFVLGSVHHPRDDRRVDIQATPPQTLLELYFDEVDALLDFGDFDSLAHLDYPVRLWHVPGRTFLAFEKRIDSVLRRIAEKGIALEVNSSGLFDEMGRVGPEKWVLEHFRAFGGTYVTLGSDAHHAAHVGRGLSEARAQIRAAGFENVTCYVKRQPVLLPIAAPTGK